MTKTPKTFKISRYGGYTEMWTYITHFLYQNIYGCKIHLSNLIYAASFCLHARVIFADKQTDGLGLIDIEFYAIQVGGNIYNPQIIMFIIPPNINLILPFLMFRNHNLKNLKKIK